MKKTKYHARLGYEDKSDGYINQLNGMKLVF